MKTDSSSSRASKSSSSLQPGPSTASTQNVETTLILPVDTEKDEMIQKSKIENSIPEERKRKKELAKTDSEETDFKDKPKKKKKKNGEKEDKKVTFPKTQSYHKIHTLLVEVNFRRQGHS